MKFKAYSNPQDIGWLGWLENCVGQVVGFVKLDGSIVWEW